MYCQVVDTTSLKIEESTQMFMLTFLYVTEATSFNLAIFFTVSFLKKKLFNQKNSAKQRDDITLGFVTINIGFLYYFRKVSK